MFFVAPDAATYATRVPYITPGEFRAHPTGMETNQLVPGGTKAANDQALLQVIRRASSYADGLCNKILAATLDTQTDKPIVQRDGTVRVALDNSPVVGVTSAAAGLRPGSLVDLVEGPDWDLSGRIFTVPTCLPRGERVHVKVQYINGWANAVLTADAAAGASSLTVSNGLGIIPGMTLTLSGAEASEFVVVDPSYSPSAALGPVTVPLAAPLLSAYAAGDVFTAIPAEVKLAVILLTCAIIKTRGASAVVMASVNAEPDHEVPFEDGATGEYGMAVDLLHPYRRVL
jgi:hypothetical protein